MIVNMTIIIIVTFVESDPFDSVDSGQKNNWLIMQIKNMCPQLIVGHTFFFFLVFYTISLTFSNMTMGHLTMDWI